MGDRTFRLYMDFSVCATLYLCSWTTMAEAISIIAGDFERPESAHIRSIDKRAVVDEYDRLTGAGVFGPVHRVGLLHGRMSGDEKAQALRAFSR